MFDIGFSEMFLVTVIALIVIGPERLPSVARKLGMYIRKAKHAFNNVKREVESELDTEELNRKLAENNILGDNKSIKDEFKSIKDKINEDPSKKPIE
jgi:sec-independent protein translocase protein TatB